jgi:hypothetical protein
MNRQGGRDARDFVRLVGTIHVEARVRSLASARQRVAAALADGMLAATRIMKNT